MTAVQVVMALDVFGALCLAVLITLAALHFAEEGGDAGGAATPAGPRAVPRPGMPGLAPVGAPAGAGSGPGRHRGAARDEPGLLSDAA